MEEKNKTQQDVLLLDAAENIQSTLENFWSVQDLWKSLAKASTILAFCQRNVRKGIKVSEDELDCMVTLVNQFNIILQALEKFDDASKR